MYIGAIFIDIQIRGYIDSIIKGVRRLYVLVNTINIKN